MSRLRSALPGLFLAALPLLSSAPARASSPSGVALIEVLGARVESARAPGSGKLGALVALPRGVTAASLGLQEAAPGFGRLSGRAAISDFAARHPDLPIELGSRIKLLNDRVGEFTRARVAEAAGVDGRGALIGVADTGLDVSHPDFLDDKGKSRVEWLLDLSRKPVGLHPELEKEFGVTDDRGALFAGAIYSKADIDLLLEKKVGFPTDEVGHGTHVMGIAGGGGSGSAYKGVAPRAGLLAVRLTRPGTDLIDNDDLVRAVAFLFKMGDALKRPMVVNLSLGSDFGPHDGSFLWEQAIAAFVGPERPGHAIIAAAGNSGSVAEVAIHQSVHVAPGTRTRVPVKTGGSASGTVQIWIALRAGSAMNVGLEGPDGEWIAPVSPGKQGGRKTDGYSAGVIHGAQEGQPIPAGHAGAIAVWTGKWPPGPYAITLEGEGNAELYLESIGADESGSVGPTSFLNGIREGTVNLPATHPSIIGVGCSVNRTRWRSAAGSEITLGAPSLDKAGFLPTGDSRELAEGEVCWFSSAGPTVTGAMKPEIGAPGGLVASSISSQAEPGSPRSIFTSPSCPKGRTGRADPRCFAVDERHGISAGTSMSAPVVSGVVALLFQLDPTLTQEKVAALLQGGAHRFRGAAPFEDQSGPGEVDAMGSIDALARMHDPKTFLPSTSQSWIVLSSDYLPADGSREVTAVIELRTEDGEHRADMFEASRLQPAVSIAGLAADSPSLPRPSLTRRGPGVWAYSLRAPGQGLGGRHVTLGATFDGKAVVSPKRIPIATDGWNANYPSSVFGGCSATGARGLPWAWVVALAALVIRRRRSA